MIEPSSINEVLARADIVEIIGQAVRLKKRGSNYVANCPFHNEKTPSFSVSASKGLYKCFGCGRGGNVVSFVQEYEKLSFAESIHWLADFYKIEIEETERSPEQLQSVQTEESLRILNEDATKFFQETLLNSEEGQTIGLSYFKQRGIRTETIEHFRLGYDPEEGSSFFNAARTKGYQAEILIKSGLVKERDGRFLDNYRGRIIFPIQSNTGRVLGFGARILKSNDRAPKYINTPENELYVKSRVLYGLYQARQSIAKLDECLLVEGYLDVISLHQAGITNAVASSGTSLTEDQLRAIGHLTKNLTILYDADAAGIKAALRGMDMGLSQGFHVYLALLPGGEDPDSFVQKNGRSAFEEFIKTHKQDFIGFRLELGLKEVGNDPVKKAKLVNEIAESIAHINKAEDFTLRQHYTHQASVALAIDEAGMITLVNKYLQDQLEAKAKIRRSTTQEPESEPQNTENPATEQAKSPAATNDERQEWALLKVLIESGHLAYSETESVAALLHNRVDPALIKTALAREMFDLYFAEIGIAKADADPKRAQAFFIHHPNQDIRQKTASLLHSGQEVSANWKKMFGIGTMTEREEIDIRPESKLKAEMFGLAPTDSTVAYISETNSTLSYFEIKKLRNMQDLLREQLKQEADADRIGKLFSLYKQLKKEEQTILETSKTVIFKS
ncbi:MAG: DNA primase [Bacteroidetes bacterium]|nr:DNA primase [Bacteroidota bacterium]